MVVPQLYKNFEPPFASQKVTPSAEQDMAPPGGPKDKDKDESQFNYLEQVDNLWYNVQKKVEEKLVESCKIMREELIQIQRRHRQFYRV